MKNLSLGILLSLCRRARTDGVRRLRTILDQADPQDIPLRRYLLGLSAQLGERLKEMDRFGSKGEGPVGWNPDEAKTRRLLKRFFPSVSQSLGAGHVNREAAMHFVERLEEELARFYHTVAARAPDEDSKGFFTNEGESEKSRLKSHREVLL